MSKSDYQRRHESDGFTCINCKLEVSGQAWGTKHRNHCPACLHSKHVDETPHAGDRSSPCKGVMEPIGIEVCGRDGEWAIIHRCRSCGVLRTNRIAGDDAERSLLALALRPIANPAFPIDSFR
jgi:RNHCP domain